MGALRCSVMYGGTNRTDKEVDPAVLVRRYYNGEWGFAVLSLKSDPKPGFAYLSSLLAPELNESSANSNGNGFGAIISA